MSWAIPKGLPCTTKKHLAIHVENHPLEYITFQGTIPSGQYGAGTVEIFDQGTYIPLSDIKKGLKNGEIKILLIGEKNIGVWTLIKKDEKNWFVLKCDNRFLIQKQSKQKLPFKNANVQLAQLSNQIPKGKEWCFEIKFDGYRIVSYVQNKKVVLKTRNNNDFSSKFQNVLNDIKEHFQNLNVVLDGEIVVFDNLGKTSFSLLQDSIKKGENNFFYVVFDLLALDGLDLRNASLTTRKQVLKILLDNSPQSIIFSEHVIDEGSKCFDLAKKKNLEGIIAKKIDSVYAGERNGDWLKIKCYKRQEFVVCGYTKTEKNKLVSSLVLGVYQDKELVYVGKVGTGLSNKQKLDLIKLFKTLETKKIGLKGAPKNTIFLKPKLIAEIQFAEYTKDNLLRQPSFVAFREDKNVKQVVKEI